MTSVSCFAPIATPASHVLILGSMPGKKSLQEQQYYAHPRNAFWPVMAALFGTPADDYAQRVALIRDNKLALWDVLAECLRPGSLDQAIDRKTAQVNDFASFFKAHPKIEYVFFNGGAAHDLFMQRVWPLLDVQVKNRLTLQRLPSTSPAMASLSLEKKIAAWQPVRRAQAPRNGRATGG